MIDIETLVRQGQDITDTLARNPDAKEIFDWMARAITALKEERQLHGEAIKAGVYFGTRYEQLRKDIENAPCPGYNTANGPVYWCGEGTENCGCWKRAALEGKP